MSPNPKRNMSHEVQRLQTAIALHQEGRLQAAEDAYRTVLQGNGLNAEALRLLGALYLQTGRFAQSAEVLEKAARLLPKNVEVLTNLGVALRALKRPDEAIVRFQQALAVRPDYLSALANLGNLFQESGRAAEAVPLCAQIVQLCPDNAPATFNYGNSLLATGNSLGAIQSYEQALKLKPDYLDAMINLGIALGLAGKNDRSQQWFGVAQSWFEKALALDPKNAVAMNNLGNILRQQGRSEEAVLHYRKALDLRPDYAEAAINLATGLHDLGLLDEALENCRKALRLLPESVEARNNLGTYLQEKGAHEEALELFDEALQRQPTSLDAQWNKALSLLALGRYKEGWRLHEGGLGRLDLRGAYASERRWNGEALAGKRLLIRCEQGLGDDLQFVRYAELCKAQGGTVLVQCPAALLRLLANCPFIDALSENFEAQDYDLHVPIMSLPYVFGTELDTVPANIPYLHVSVETRARWAGKITEKSGFKVGLVWAGNPRNDQLAAHLIDGRRSMDLEQLRPLFEVKGVDFYNLQMGEKAQQIDHAGLGAHLVDFMGEVRDFEDTAALIEQLDLVISVDTSVVHLVGGMGRPVWVLSRFDACWRWLQNRSENPWYPTARIFGQAKAGAWAEVVARVKTALDTAKTAAPLR